MLVKLFFVLKVNVNNSEMNKSTDSINFMINLKFQLKFGIFNYVWSGDYWGPSQYKDAIFSV